MTPAEQQTLSDIGQWFDGLDQFLHNYQDFIAFIPIAFVALLILSSLRSWLMKD